MPKRVKHLTASALTDRILTVLARRGLTLEKRFVYGIVALTLEALALEPITQVYGALQQHLVKVTATGGPLRKRPRWIDKRFAPMVIKVREIEGRPGGAVLTPGERSALCQALAEVRSREDPHGAELRAALNKVLAAFETRVVDDPRGQTVDKL